RNAASYRRRLYGNVKWTFALVAASVTFAPSAMAVRKVSVQSSVFAGGPPSRRATLGIFLDSLDSPGTTLATLSATLSARLGPNGLATLSTIFATCYLLQSVTIIAHHIAAVEPSLPGLPSTTYL